MIKKSLVLLGAATFILPTVASAYEAGDILVRVGAANVTPESKSDAIDQVSTAAVSANSNTQLGFSATYMLENNIGIELLAVTPFTHKIEGDGAIDGTDIGEISHLPPTLSAQYYLLDANSSFQPYAGIGLNYTIFFDEDADSGLAGLYDDLDLDDSFGLAAQLGFDLAIGDDLFLNASVMYADINTKATLTGPAGELTVDYELDPIVYRLNVGFKF